MIAKPTHQRVHAFARTAFLMALACGMSTSLLESRVALAEEDSNSADTAAARDLAIEGLKLADAGQCGPAIDRLARAEKLHHAPIVLGRLGECEVSQGKIVDGTENLRRLLREPLGPSPTPALEKAIERAKAALEGAKGKIAFLNISLREPARDVTVTVDGQLVPPALYDRGRPTDPGEHLVEANATGYLKWSQKVVLGLGEKQDLGIKLAVDPDAQPGAIAAAPAATPGTSELKDQNIPPRKTPGNVSLPPEPPSDSPSHTTSYVLWSLGGAAAAVGGVFGVLAIKGKGDLDSACSDSTCPSSSQSDYDSTKRNATLSTVLLGAGGGLLAVGTILYFVSGTSEKDPSTSATRRPEPLLGLGSVGLRGTF